MGGTLLHRFVFSLTRLLGLWYVTEGMPPNEIVEKALKKWRTPSAALAHLLQIESPGTNVLLASCLLWNSVELGNPSPDLTTLQKLLEELPVPMRAEAFRLATNSDTTRAASLLLQLLPTVPPGLARIAHTITEQWATIGRHDDLALTFYQSLTAYGAPQMKVKWLIARTLVARSQFTQAEPLLVEVAQNNPSPEVWWQLAFVFQALHRSPEHLLWVLINFTRNAPFDSRTVQALETIGNLYHEMLRGKPANESIFSVHPLRALLEFFPEHIRGKVLSLIGAKHGYPLLAQILVALTPPTLIGFSSIIQSIMTHWAAEARCDDLALQFYRVLPAYGISQMDAHLLLARALISRKYHSQAEPLLKELTMRSASADALWLLIQVYRELHRTPQAQHEALLQFVRCSSKDARAGLAWKMIGDLQGEQLGDGIAAVKAYRQAVELGQRVPQLRAFYAGQWDGIPALRHHQDYPFPVVVTLDLEADPKQEAVPGSRVFEVAAVRYKGRTCLDHYSSYIQRNFCPSKWDKEAAQAKLSNAPSAATVAQGLQRFIGDSIVVGHNICTFDAPQLEGMGVSIAKEQTLDTLLLARLLHPDSLRHHLAILCEKYSVVVDQSSLHSALPDAHACAHLFHALGNGLAQRETHFLTGVRALVTPQSAFDRAILQPRDIPADITLTWNLDAAPTVPRIITPLRDNQGSPAMQKALRSGSDHYVEHADFDGYYTHSLSPSERTLVTVSSRTRIERILAHHPQVERIFVLPNPQTLLCPQRVRQAIESSVSDERKLHLFCLYQGSHNHDAASLYPWRLPAEALDDPEIVTLRQILLAVCCAADNDHGDACSAVHAVTLAVETHPILLSTHEVLIKQSIPAQADTIVIDDTVQLQMNLAEYSATALTSDQMKTWLVSPAEREILSQLETHIQDWSIRYLHASGTHERLPLASLAAYLSHNSATGLTALFATLKQNSKQGKRFALILQDLIEKSTQPRDPASTQAVWIDLWFENRKGTIRVQKWSICGINQDLRLLFQRYCWKPYKNHLLAGPALSLRGNTTFLDRSLGIAGILPHHQDPRTRKRVYLTAPQVIPPTSILQRRKWILQVGALLSSRAREKYRAILVTLNDRIAVNAFIQAFAQTHDTSGRQLLATQLNWTVSKINERMHDPARKLLVFASPSLRQTLLDSPVDLEISGPLRFLNRRDPLVIAQMQVFSSLFPEEGPFTAYLLPQALLELKSRLTSDASEYLICDGGLLSKSYRDETLQLLHESADVQELTDQVIPADSEHFLETLRTVLAQQGLGQQVAISDSDLHLILRSVWETDSFRPFPPLRGDLRPALTQKDIVRGVLDEKDQLVIAATGGGKSLCFQLPAIILAEEAEPRVTLVFSPLIALMSNQVEQLNRKGIFSAIMLNSTLSLEQRQEHLEGIRKGYYSIVYLAPEQIYSKKLRDVLQYRDIGLIAIDEVHCLSQWGHNFRTDYFSIEKWIHKTLCNEQKRQFPILALTATARKGYKDAQNQERSDQASTITDIIEKLGLRIREDEVTLSSAVRPELEFHFEYITPTQNCPKCKHSYEYQTDIGPCPSCGYHPHPTKRELQHTVVELKKQRLLSLLSPDLQEKKSQLPDLYSRWSRPFGTRQRGLIYCSYRRTTEEIADFLKGKIPGLRVDAYHAGMDNADREDMVRKLTSDTEQGLDVIVCTNAFGMGVDIRRLGFVIHFDTPATPEAYYQEAGRAGRDNQFKAGKERAQCILLFHPSDLEKQRFLSSQNIFTDYEIEDVYQAICAIYARDKEYSMPSDLPDLQMFSSTNNSLHALASIQEIAERAGVQEDQVNTLLYYLEYQTKDKINHQPILERGTYASNIWQLRFEKDYQAQLLKLPPSSSSWPLVKIFLDNSDYRLTTDRFTTISARELADSRNVSLKALETELLNLVRGGIIHYAGSGQFKFNDSLPVMYEKLNILEKDLQKLFLTINTSKGKALSRNERVTANIRSVMSTHNLSTFTLSQLTKLLFRHSLESSEPLRLLEHFHRATRNGQPDNYELQLWLSRDPQTPVFAILHAIITQLVQKLEVLEARMKDSTDRRDWYVIDLFEADLHLTYFERRKFHQQLLLLETLGFLKYRSDPAMGQSLHLTLLQPPVPREQLEIDLQSLRLQESHAKSKRKLMAHYATSAQKELYSQQFAAYFQGETPLLEQGQRELRQDLTPQQRQIATLPSGIHVIEGPAGCGKTLALAEHVKYLINQQVPIDHIMITTHYTSAEGHIAEALKDLESEGATAISTTINAFGNKIFQQYRVLLRCPDGTPYYRNAQPPQLLKSRSDSEGELPYINRALKQVCTLDFADLVHHRHWPWPQGLELPQFSPNYRSNAAEEDRFQAAIHRFRQYGIFPMTPPTKESLLQMVGEHTGIYTASELYAVYMTFIKVLAEQNLYTFDDQIVFALAILRTNPEILHEYQRYFEHIIIDELQDFSPAKVELLRVLCEKRANIMAFGDIFQEVQFETTKEKGSRNGENVKSAAQTVFDSLVQLDTCEPGKAHQLSINFRSTQEILDFATFIRRKANDRSALDLRSGQNKHGPKPTYLYTRTGSELAAMVDATLSQIAQLSPSERESVVLIFGKKEHLRQAEDLLKQKNIPFSLMDGQKTQYQLHYVKNLLLYPYLVEDKTRNDETERLLRYNIIPYFEKLQIIALKKLAHRKGISLFETVSSLKFLQEARISTEQIASLQRHLAIITQSKLDTPMREFEQALRELKDGPLTLLQEQEDKLKDVETILEDFRACSIKDTIEEIRRHITFLDKHRGRTDLVLATVNYSKSQEFETVFLLGLNKVFGKRLYVSVSRAKQRLFLVGDQVAFTANFTLSQVPGGLYSKVSSAMIKAY